jgi:hypothetical protein
MLAPLPSAASILGDKALCAHSVLPATKGRQVEDAFKATHELRGNAGPGQLGENAAAGSAMNAVYVLKISMAHSNSSDRESPKQDDGESDCRPISLLSFLEAENIRLRQAVAELWFDIPALSEDLKSARILPRYEK